MVTSAQSAASKGTAPSVLSESQKGEGVKNETEVLSYCPHLGGSTAQLGLQQLKKLLSVSSFSVG